MADQDTTTTTPVEPEAPQEEGGHDPDCPHCVKAHTTHLENEEMNLAILIALVPALTLTFLSSVGLL